MESNVQKMREAFVSIAEYAKSARCHTEDGHTLGFLAQIEIHANAALALPLRQCDVGTLEEQRERFRDMCEQEKCGRYRCKWSCKATFIDMCALAWAQTPYAAQEGAGK